MATMPPRPNLVSACAPTVDRLRRQTAVKRIKMAYDLTNQITEIQSEISAVRRGAVRELRAEGWTLQAIADQAGVSVSRVKQIEQGYQSGRDRPEPVPEPVDSGF